MVEGRGRGFVEDATVVDGDGKGGSFVFDR